LVLETTLIDIGAFYGHVWREDPMSLIRCKRIYNFLCSMLGLHQLLYVLFTLRDIFMHFLELTC
jgi:hypothetical protein